MMPWRNVAATLILSGALALQTGCGDGRDSRDESGAMREAKEGTGNRQGIGQLSMRSEDGGVARVGSDQLIRIAEQVPGVEDAILAISGKDVVVGIQVANEGTKRIAEKQVVSQLMWQYPEYDYYVTADSELYNRVRTASQNQTTGQYRIKSVASDNEISSIVDAIARKSFRP